VPRGVTSRCGGSAPRCFGASRAAGCRDLIRGAALVCGINWRVLRSTSLALLTYCVFPRVVVVWVQLDDSRCELTVLKGVGGHQWVVER